MSVLLGAILLYKTQWHTVPNFQEFTSILFSMISMALLVAWGNLTNDLLDISTDQISHPQRPLVTGTLSIKWVKTLSPLFLIASAILAYFGMSQNGFLVWIGMATVLLIYNVWAKKIPLLGNFLVALLCGLAITMTEWSPYPLVTLFPAWLAFIANLIRELIKDLEDISGDKNSGRRTAPIAWGLSFSHKLVLMGSTVLVGSLFLPLVFPYTGLGLKYLLFLGLLGTFPLVLLFRSITQHNWHSAQSALKLFMITGLLSIFLDVWFRS